MIVEQLDGGHWFPIVYKLKKGITDVNFWKAERVLVVLTSKVDEILNQLTLERLDDPESEQPKNDRGLLKED